MIETRDISNPDVLKALNEVPREELVPEHLRTEAYGDYPLPIGHGQTISQPYIVGKMTELLEPAETDRVLEIGTGSGYQAAVLSRIVEHVYSVEILPELAKQAENQLDKIGCTNVTVRHGDGYSGWPEQAPFDKIILTAAPEEMPAPLLEQLGPGGILVAPIGPVGGTQWLKKITRQPDGSLKEETDCAVRFVPFTRREEE